MIWYIVSITDLILFIMVAFTVLYFTVFAFASLFYSKFEAPRSRRSARFLVVVSARMADEIIFNTIEALNKQTYDHKNFDIVVVSYGNTSLTNMKLAQHRLHLLIMNKDAEFSDVLAWQHAIQHCPPLRIYDMVVILEGGETMDATYLQDINEAFQLGSKAIQTHRSTRQLDTPRAIMAATFEDINSCIFRMGHVALGMASGLLGSGMAFDFRWFKEHIMQLPEGSDLKDFEAAVLQDRKYVDFLDDTFFYNKPIQFRGGIRTTERSGWMYAQWSALRRHIRQLPMALLHHNYDFADKIIQWMLMPRVVMMAIIAIMSVITPLFWWSMAIKWIVTGFWIVFIFAVATPDYLINRKWEKAYRHAPMLMVQTLFFALPAGWIAIFVRNHKDEWQDDMKRHTDRLVQQGGKLVQQGGKIVQQGGKLVQQASKLVQNEATDRKEETES
ncbi:MAG: glycosyltransferase [Bacteroidaceae bacterium]|nr:glycosyltransferase [Bacteroidaceae bacterium]